MKSKPKRFSAFLTAVFSLAVIVASYAAFKDSSDITQPVGADILQVSTSTADKNSADNIDEVAQKGKLLYENHCRSCHESMVHIRAKTKVRSYHDIQYWVGRWAIEVDLKWTSEEIEAVVNYLNSEHYKFPH
ncbi:hypothetical protein [Kaarinaea lacus]